MCVIPSIVVEKPKHSRIFLSLPDGIRAALERWADSEGNRPTTLANFIVERAVREALEQGLIPPETPEKTQQNEPDLQAFVSRLLGGDFPTNGELVKLAHDWGIPTEQLLELRDRMKPIEKKRQTNGT